AVTAPAFQQAWLIGLQGEHLVAIVQPAAGTGLEVPLGLAQPNVFTLLGPPAGTLGHGSLNTLRGQARGFSQGIYSKPGAFNSQVDGLAHGWVEHSGFR